MPTWIWNTSSLNDGAATVKGEIIKRAHLSNILFNDEQFDISWEERSIDGIAILMFTALSPAPYAQDAEHAFLILLEPANNSTQFPATYNHIWTSQTRFDLCEQLRKTPHAQQAHLNDQRLLVVDGLYLVD